MCSAVLTEVRIDGQLEQATVMDYMEFAHTYYNYDWWYYVAESEYDPPSNSIEFEVNGVKYYSDGNKYVWEGYHRNPVQRYKNLKHLRQMLKNTIKFDNEVVVFEAMNSFELLPCKYFVVVKNLFPFLK